MVPTMVTTAAVYVVVVVVIVVVDALAITSTVGSEIVVPFTTMCNVVFVAKDSFKLVATEPELATTFCASNPTDCAIVSGTMSS
mmetsp:Transcript_32246/g.85894  ORF Transcript_32246/g.85894 Transcript_32246/m.85894 type:complete len:84 (+) Transcript_32246:608-859(+)